ncbi:alpha/beta fold hydrolase [Flaviflexus massiliensis]|uniref:alpha/beta fold hydrolase n=1 Tax=Flaviflexus massiliensis TaxID=1522309 RepID=UPI0006D53F93|nr:alpha/beta hydrolase [Flaviflexus massiliensis]
MTYLSYRWTGDRTTTPWVLLHAMPFDSTMFNKVRTYLPSVITFDAPGFGESLPGHELDGMLGVQEPSLDTYARAIAHDLEELRARRFHIGGVSMGGAVTAAVVSLGVGHEGVALIDTNIGADTEEAAKNRREAARKADEGDASSVLGMADGMTAKATQQGRPEIYADIQRRLREVNPQSLAWMQRAMAARPDRHDVLKDGIRALLLVRGDEDPTMSPTMIDRLAKEYPATAVTKTIAAAGHFAPLETPSELGEILADFTTQQL